MNIGQGWTRCAAAFVVAFVALFGYSEVSAQELVVCNSGNNTLVQTGTKGGGNPTVLAAFVAPCRDVKVLDSTTAYVTVPANNSVAAVNLVTKSATSIPTGINPQTMTLNAARTRLYVVSNTNVTTVDTATNTVIAGESFDLAANGGYALSIAARGSQIAIGTQDRVLLFDVSASPVILLAEKFTGTRIMDVAFSQDGANVYAVLGTYTEVFDENNIPVVGNVYVLRVPSLAVKSALQIGFIELQQATLVKGQFLYISGIDGSMFVVDTSLETLATSYLAGITLSDIVTNDQKVFVTDPFQNIVQIIVLGRTPERDRVDGSILLDIGAQPISLDQLPQQQRGKK